MDWPSKIKQEEHDWSTEKTMHDVKRAVQDLAFGCKDIVQDREPFKYNITLQMNCSTLLIISPQHPEAAQS